MMMMEKNYRNEDQCLQFSRYDSYVLFSSMKE